MTSKTWKQNMTEEADIRQSTIEMFVNYLRGKKNHQINDLLKSFFTMTA